MILKNIFYFFIISLLLLSCTKSRDFHNSDEAINDSISLLIDLYKSEGDIVEKKKILSKAVSFLNNNDNC